MRRLHALGLLLLPPLLSGCDVMTVAGAAVSVGAAVVGTAVDVTVGAVKVTGKAIGSAVDAVSGADEAVPPALDVRTGRPVTFLVRTCRTTQGEETWDFGDGSEPVTVKSDGCAEEKAREGYARTQYVFQKPGDYLVKVERSNQRGEKATAQLWVPVRK